jgi:xanthosine utilization system XapX-like protein
MYLVYLLPLFLVVLVALAIFAPPVLAVLVFVAFLIGLGAYKFLTPGTEHAPRAETTQNEEETGIWGERRPS